MRSAIIILLISLLTFSCVYAVGGKCRKHSISDEHQGTLDNVSIDLDDGTVIITNEGWHRATVEITEDYELYVNGRFVETDREQEELIKEYYDQVVQIVEHAKEIGYEGAKIGLRGARIGFRAVRGVFRLLLTDYDDEDLERELERDAEVLEARAEELEERAEVLEDLADELEEMQEELADEIPELRKLDWF